MREAAIESVGRHPELGDAGRAAIAEALASPAPGIVAVAADVVQGHPDRVFVLAESERRAALDPAAPPPSTNPAREIDPAVAKALRAALAHPWHEDEIETRIALVDAALAAGLPEATDLARRECRDDNVTVRARGAKALAAAGEKDPRCPVPEASDAGAPASPPPALAAPVHVVFDTDAGPLGIRLAPDLAPIAAARVLALARSGFYTGVVVHRVVEGFVVQLGDRGGDGYGGSGQTLRCETAPAPFEPLDVGLALAGRDTGSSQIFITLARYPHLDGVSLAREGRRRLDGGRRGRRGPRRTSRGVAARVAAPIAWKDRVVVVTGGSVGIGAALAREVGRRGGSVVIAARRADKLAEVADSVQAPCVTVEADVTRRPDVARILDAAKDRFGKVDVWVNNAGRGISRVVEELTDDDVDEMVRVNVKSALYGMQTVLPHFRERGRGHLVNVSSMLARVPFVSFRSAYSASKQALNCLTENVRTDLSKDHPEILVTCVMPGVVTTDFGLNALHGGLDSRSFPASQTPEQVAAIIADALERGRGGDVYTSLGAVERVVQYIQGLAAERSS